MLLVNDGRPSGPRNVLLNTGQRTRSRRWIIPDKMRHWLHSPCRPNGSWGFQNTRAQRSFLTIRLSFLSKLNMWFSSNTMYWIFTGQRDSPTKRLKLIMKDNDISHVRYFFKVVWASHGLSLKISLTFNSEQEWKILFVLPTDGRSSTHLRSTLLQSLWLAL